MQRAVVTCLTLAVVLGCRDQSTMTSLTSPTIAAALLDGGHGGNPHFFFLPPIAPTPTPNGPFNPRLTPVVEICSAPEAPCTAGHVLATLGPVNAQDTAQYRVNWDSRTLNLPAGASVRVIVRVGTAHLLGFVDVDLVSNAGARNGQTNANLQLVDGQTLPIKFRIEQGALTPDQTCTDCAEQTISTSTGSATVVTSKQLAGAFFPQGALPQDVTVIIEATPPATGQTCIPLDLDQFPGCYTFSTDPGPTTFNSSVTAGICVETDGLTPDEIKSLILYQLDVVSERNVITPLEDAPAAFLPCNALAATRAPHGLLARAREALLGLLVPAPLHAAHLGVGGLTSSFSKIGWGRPPTMSPVPGTDGGIAAPGAPVTPPPAVLLLNSHNQPVSGLPVTFVVAAGGGSIMTPSGGGATAGPVTVTTDVRGIAALGGWSLGSTPGPNTLTAREIGALGGPLTFGASSVAGFFAVSAGVAHTCGLRGSGLAYCWGANGVGQVGDGTTTNRLMPVAVAEGRAFVALAAGIAHTCALVSGGAAFCWGSNFAGQVGDGTTNDRLSPVAVSGGLAFVALSGGGNHTCGLTATGAAYCWGANGAGQVGDGTTINRSTPVAVAGGLAFVVVSARGSHTCALTAAGAAYCWGFNFAGELGDGTTTNRATPVPVTGAVTFGALVTGAEHTCALTSGGVAYCWGDNSVGELGNGTATDAPTTSPVAVTGNLTFKALAARAAHTCGLTIGGAAYCWGDNFSGDVGDGTTVVRVSPTAVTGGLTFLALAAGGAHSCGLTSTGAIDCWGYNGDGELGDGTGTTSLTPVAVVGP
jgi:alpha-tubulin suppressor-like RCC1 family protein